jgi:hypothetical protein
MAQFIDVSRCVARCWRVTLDRPPANAITRRNSGRELREALLRLCRVIRISASPF